MYISTEWSCLIYKGIYICMGMGRDYNCFQELPCLRMPGLWPWQLHDPGRSQGPIRFCPWSPAHDDLKWLFSPSVRGKKNLFWWALYVKAIGCNWRMPFARLFDKSHGNGSGIVKVSCMVQFWHTIPFWLRHFFIQLLQGTMFLKPSHAADLLAGFVEDLGYVMVYPNSWQFYATQL